MAFVSLMLMWLAFAGLILGFLLLIGMIFLILPVGTAVLIEINTIASLFPIYPQARVMET